MEGKGRDMREHEPCYACKHFRDVKVMGNPNVGVCAILRFYPYGEKNMIPVNKDDNRLCKYFLKKRAIWEGEKHGKEK
jgi:hypothetical protein